MIRTNLFIILKAIWRNAQKFGLQCAYRSQKTVWNLIQELNALLPMEDILRGFQVKPLHMLFYKFQTLLPRIAEYQDKLSNSAAKRINPNSGSRKKSA